MPRLRRLSGSQICRILEAEGFVNVRQRGSHIIMQKQLPDTTITVPVPNHREVAIGTLRAIIRQAQLPRVLFE